MHKPLPNSLSLSLSPYLSSLHLDVEGSVPLKLPETPLSPEWFKGSFEQESEEVGEW